MLPVRACLAGALKTASKFSNLKYNVGCLSSDTKSVQIRGADPTSKLIWIDLELTGLNLEKDLILEAACVVTDANLNVLGSCLDVVIHQSEEVLDNMPRWCQETHRKSGLIDAVLKSTLTVKEAEDRLLEFVNTHTTPGTCPLAGNTVYMDRFFLSKYMNRLNEHMHYRIVDVSSIKELCRRWSRDIFTQAPQKTFIHRAGADIFESIEELKHYKANLFDHKS